MARSIRPGSNRFAIGVVLQLTGSPHIGLAISMVGSLVAAVGGLRRPRGAHEHEHDPYYPQEGFGEHDLAVAQ